jgi:nuclear pore complex protein Nup98-Nup96
MLIIFSPSISIAAFGQSSTSPFGNNNSFGTPQGFGQSSTAANNPFAPKPFGSPTTPFGAQTGSSLFATTSTGAFGQQQSAPAFGTTSTGAFGQQQSTPTFGTPSSSQFGSSTPAFGASPTPAFGATSSGMYYILYRWFTMLIILGCHRKQFYRLSN